MESKKLTMTFRNGSTSYKFVEGRYLGDNCYVLNENGTIKLSTGSEYQQVRLEMDTLSSGEYLLIIFQSQEEFRNRKEHLYVSLYRQILKLPYGKYEIDIREKHISSLPAPYTSNCTDGDLVSNIFASKYTYDSCQETCAHNHMYQECGDTNDIWKKHHAPIQQIFNNSKYFSRESCISNLLWQATLRKFPVCSCNRACKEVVYTETTTEIGSSDSFWYLTLYNKGAVTELKLVEDYPLEAFIGSLGGVLGLGGKIMATLQLIIFISLCIAYFRTQ